MEVAPVPPSPPAIPRRRRSRRAAARRRRQIFLGLFCLGVASATLGLALWLDNPPKTELTSRRTAGASEERIPAAPGPAAANIAAETRAAFRHSVVPGGVRTPAELAGAMARDSVVAAHYAGVNTRAMRVEQLRQPMLAYVSYRIGDKVYWTSRKLTVNAGERVLTDGTTTIRARCGNQVSLQPLAPVLAEEPAPEEFDSLGEPVIMAALPSEAVADPADPAGRIPMVDPPDPPVTTIDPIDPIDEVPVPVPEPSTLLLVGAGAAAGLVRRFRKRRARES